MLKLTWKTIRIPWLAKPCWCGTVDCQKTSHRKPSRRSDASRRRQSEARKIAWHRKKEVKNGDALAGIDVTTLSSGV